MPLHAVRFRRESLPARRVAARSAEPVGGSESLRLDSSPAGAVHAPQRRAACAPYRTALFRVRNQGISAHVKRI
jgi:hypothetical protein